MNYKLVIGMLITFCLALGLRAQDVVDVKVAPVALEKSKIDVVFVLDTTGSMGGLIAAAKTKIWTVVNALGQASPPPLIRIGLVGYRDKGDAYITKRVDISDNIDAVYAKLMEFKADGGGDTPESVNQALNEAVTLMPWNKSADAYKVIFLVGDCPPHMDYQDDVKYQESCKLAKAADIVFNTIQCGNQPGTTPIWKEIATLGAGEFFQIAQDGASVAVATPFDGEIATLSSTVDRGMTFYGKDPAKSEGVRLYADATAIAAAAPVEAVAERAGYKATAGKDSLRDRNELLTDIENNTVKLKDIPNAELPTNMQKMTPEEQEKYVTEQLATRKAANAKLVELNNQRQEFLKKEAEKKPEYKSSFDYQVLNCIKNQAASKNIKFVVPDKAPEKVPDKAVAPAVVIIAPETK